MEADSDSGDVSPNTTHPPGKKMRGQETLDAPLLPINECIFPDKWLNIPSCLVRAFEDDIKNQLYLERLAHNLGYKANKLEVKVSDQRR